MGRTALAAGEVGVEPHGMEHRAAERPPALIDQNMYCPRAKRMVDVEQCFACSWSRPAKRREHVLPVACGWRDDRYQRLVDSGFIL